MTCTECLVRGETWSGEAPRCAFGNARGTFSGENWNCATMNALRGLCGQGEGAYGAARFRCDEAAGSLGVLRIPDEADMAEGHPLRGYLVMTWYKDRGRTDQAWVMNEDDPPAVLGLLHAEAILRAYRQAAPGSPEQ